MMRPIDGDALVRKMCFRCKDGDGEGACAEFCRFVECLDKTPTLDLAPVVHGEWIKQKNGRLICSVCGVRGLQDSDELDYYCYPSAYCPNCGAKMDGGEKDETT